MESLQVFYDNISSRRAFEDIISNNSKFSILKIIGCPSASAVIDLLSQNWFKYNVNEIFTFHFIINGNIKEDEWEKMKSFRKLMTLFESYAENKFLLFFKTAHEYQKRLNLRINLSAFSDNIRKFIVTHVHSSLANNSYGLLPNLRELTNLKITSFGDENGFNLLMMATAQNRGDIVKELISLKCFDVNHKVGNVSAIDLAWNEGFYDIVLDLLNANSLFPSNFYLRVKTTDEIQNISEATSRLHNLITIHSIKQNNISEISQILDQNLNLRHFFNDKNQSASFVALENKQFNIYELLVSKNVVIAQTDSPQRIKEILENLPDSNKEKIRDIHQKCARDLSKKHILRLLINSFVGLDDLKSEERFSLVWDAFETLDKIEFIQPILELVSYAGKFKIFFDFHRDSVQFLDPYQADEGTNGLFYQNGLIYVAAKSLLNEQTRNLTIGILAHELCHFAMVLVYRNGARPYAIGDFKTQKSFELISNICSLSQKLEEIIRWVYEHYGSDLWHQELIVRIPHILGHYFNDESKIQELLTSDLAPFRIAYVFYYYEVLPHIKTAIPVLAQITDEDLTKTLTFNSLTPQLKSKVKNSEVLFQGHKLSLLKVVEENSKAFDELSSDQLIKLINSEEIEISQIIEDNVEVYVERKLAGICKEDKDETFLITFDELIFIESRVVLLSDFAGAGKTTALTKVAHKIKKVFTFKWIQFIDLKSHFDAFKECKEHKFESLEKLSTFLCSKVLKLNEKKLEKEIFVELFADGKVVFIFDGVDEISPSFNEFARNLFLKIKELTRNIQWISTRPECARELEKVLDTTSYKFSPLSITEVNRILEMFFKTQKLNNINLENRIKIAKTIIEELSYKNKKNREVENPLLIKMIANESLDHDFTKSINIFSLFENFFQRKQKIIYEKGDEVHKDCIKAASKRMTISQVHQCYAIKLLYADDISNKNFARLNILTKKVPWTADQINRYGILYLHDDGRFDFVHRSFAEYFASQYIIENIYDCDDSPTKDEANKRVKLLFHTIEYKTIVANFFENYLDLKLPSAYEFDKSIQSLIICEFKRDFKYVIETFPFFIKFFRKSYDAVKSLFFRKDENILIISLRKDTKGITNTYDQVLGLAKENLTEEDLEKLMDIKNQKGKFLYLLLKGKKRVSEDKNILKMNDEQIDEFFNTDNFTISCKRVFLTLSNFEFL